MKNFIKWLGIIALAAVIGFTFAACGDAEGGTTNPPDGGNNAVKETYNSADGSRIDMYNNGSFTLYDNKVEIAKGTYTSSGNNITMTFTEYKGSFLKENGFDEIEGLTLTAAQWYNQQQLRTAIINYFVSLGITQAQAEATYNEEVKESVDEMYSSFTVSKSGNTLIIIIFGEPTNFNGSGAPTYSLEGVWLMEGHTVVTINGSTGVFTSINLSELGPLSQSAVNKGYVKVGDQFFKNLTKTGDLTWTGQQLEITFNNSAPNVATGTYWKNCTITMNANGQTFTDGGDTYTRQ
jgi:hypothetical protein